MTKLDKKIEETIKEFTIGYGCKVCGGGGSIDDNGKEICTKCNGLGITNWEFNYCVPQIKKVIREEIDNGVKERIIYLQSNFLEGSAELNNRLEEVNLFKSVIKNILD